MVNRERMKEEFIELVKIDSLSLQERAMADVLKSKLQKMGYEVYEDGAGEKIGGNAGNLLCTVKGTKQVPAVLLAAHMDTVTPGTGKTAVVEDGFIKSGGDTILGGDDAAGILCILEAIRVLREKKLPHGDIQIVFTVAEELGLLGAKYLDYGRIYAKYGFVLDHGGPIGSVAVNAPSQNEIIVAVKGKAAHSGVEPEKGVNAIQIAARAIASMKLGRIDEETTANIGIITGGQTTNIVCDRVEVRGEARSRSEAKLKQQTLHMEECFRKAAGMLGGSVEFKAELMYPAFKIDENSDIIAILKKAAEKTGVRLTLDATGGGSDTNIFNGNGIQSVNLSVGMDKVHTVEERISLDDLAKACEFLIAAITFLE